ncbi:MAG: hypothetical protein WBN15_20835 [Polyangiales bacterium]
MNKVFLAVALICGLAMGCDSTDLDGAGGAGGAPVIGPLTWTVSDYTVVTDACEAVAEDPPDFVFNTFEITIDGDVATLVSEFDNFGGEPLGGVADPYSPDDNPVIFASSYTTGVMETPDCVVNVTDEYSVALEDPFVSLDQNATVEVTWNHDESDGSVTPGTCDPPVWFVELRCASQATFTLTQDPAPEQ